MENDLGTRLVVEVIEQDDKFYYDISSSQQLSLEQTRAILVGALHLAVIAEETPSKQGKALKEVIGFLEDSFIDPEGIDLDISQ